MHHGMLSIVAVGVDAHLFSIAVVFVVAGFAVVISAAAGGASDFAGAVGSLAAGKKSYQKNPFFELSMVVCRALQQVVQSPPSTGKHNRRELYRSMKNLRSEVGFCRVQLILE